MRSLVTVGVYGSDGEAFIAALREANVKLLLDVRQRRAVRGAEYAWANSLRLQAALAEAGIAYRHLPELAPTSELRALQYEEDDRQGVGKRSRIRLAPEYVERFTRERLDPVDLAPIVDSLPEDGATALFCVERDADACHRTLVAARIAQRYGLQVEHLRP